MLTCNEFVPEEHIKKCSILNKPPTKTGNICKIKLFKVKRGKLIKRLNPGKFNANTVFSDENFYIEYEKELVYEEDLKKSDKLLMCLGRVNECQSI